MLTAASVFRRGLEDSKKAFHNPLFWVLEVGGSTAFGVWWKHWAAGFVFALGMLIAIWIGATASVPLRRNQQRWRLMLGGTLIGAFVGGVVGGAIGLVVDKQRTLVAQLTEQNTRLSGEHNLMVALERLRILEDRWKAIREQEVAFQTAWRRTEQMAFDDTMVPQNEDAWSMGWVQWASDYRRPLGEFATTASDIGIPLVISDYKTGDAAPWPPNGNAITNQQKLAEYRDFYSEYRAATSAIESFKSSVRDEIMSLSRQVVPIREEARRGSQ